VLLSLYRDLVEVLSAAIVRLTFRVPSGLSHGVIQKLSYMIKLIKLIMDT
jgi:hypothetical protein